MPEINTTEAYKIEIYCNANMHRTTQHNLCANVCNGFRSQLAVLDDGDISEKGRHQHSDAKQLENETNDALLRDGFLFGVAVAFGRENNVDGTFLRMVRAATITATSKTSTCLHLLVKICTF